MKKIFSLLLCVAMVLSFSTVAFAGTPNFNATVTPAEVAVGDTVTVVLSMNECRLGTVGASVVFDKDVFECTSIVADADSDNQLAGYIADEDAEVSTVETANTYGSVGVGKTRSERNYAAGNVITATFVAKAASAGAVFKLTEDSDGTNEYRDAEGRVVATVVVKGGEPEAPVVGTPSNDGDNAKVWAVTVAGDYVATKNGALDATLTQNDLSDTQEFKLNVNGIGEAEWTFNVRVTFTDPQYRANTVLTVE